MAVAVPRHVQQNETMVSKANITDYFGNKDKPIAKKTRGGAKAAGGKAHLIAEAAEHENTKSGPGEQVEDTETPYGPASDGTMKVISFNVNGIRAALKKGIRQYIAREAPDLVALQETKIHQTKIGEVPMDQSGQLVDGYRVRWFSAEKQGYSGVAVIYKASLHDQLTFTEGIGLDHRMDTEGRVLTVVGPTFVLVACYTPNSGSKDTTTGWPARLDDRVDIWDRSFSDHINGQRAAHPDKAIIVTGDLNVAHEEIDIKNPKANTKSAGFTPRERESFTQILDTGFVDTFRELYPDKTRYTWWSYRSGARARNIGWRLDYFLVDRPHVGWVVDSFVRCSVKGSDHCPVGLVIRKEIEI